MSKQLVVTNGLMGEEKAALIVFPKREDGDVLLCVQSREEEASVYLGKVEAAQLVAYLKKQFDL